MELSSLIGGGAAVPPGDRPTLWFVSSTVWTPDFKGRVRAHVIGGGGGGRIGGGGAGGYARKDIDVDPATSLTLTIGLGGIGDTTAPGSGSLSRLVMGALTITANGGSPGSSTTVVGGAGGTATGGDYNITGGAGGNGTTSWGGSGGGVGLLGTGHTGGHTTNLLGGSIWYADPTSNAVAPDRTLWRAQFARSSVFDATNLLRDYPDPHDGTFDGFGGFTVSTDAADYARDGGRFAGGGVGEGYGGDGGLGGGGSGAESSLSSSLYRGDGGNGVIILEILNAEG